MKLTKQLLRKLIKETIKENKMNLVEAKLNMNFNQVMDVLRGNTNIKSVGIMSGQNPMAQSTTPQRNTMLATNLNSKLDSLGLDYKTVDGVFSGHPEKSVIIMNPSMRQMQELNAEFTVNDSVVCTNTPVIFSGVDNVVSNWNWDFGNGNTSTLKNLILFTGMP